MLEMFYRIHCIDMDSNGKYYKTYIISDHIIGWCECGGHLPLLELS